MMIQRQWSRFIGFQICCPSIPLKDASSKLQHSLDTSLILEGNCIVYISVSESGFLSAGLHSTSKETV